MWYNIADNFPSRFMFPPKYQGPIFVTDSSSSFGNRGSVKLLASNRIFLVGPDVDKAYKNPEKKCGMLTDRCVVGVRKGGRVTMREQYCITILLARPSTVFMLSAGVPPSSPAA